MNRCERWSRSASALHKVILLYEIQTTLEQQISKSSTTQARKEVDCPKCGQKKGKPCRMPKGRKPTSNHWQRGKAYLDLIGREEFDKRHSVQPSPLEDSRDHTFGLFDS